MKNNSIDIIACSVFKYEVDKISRILDLDVPISYFDSYLHLFPVKLSETLTAEIENKISLGKKVLLIYGDCHPFMKEMEQKENVCKIQGCNCVEILIGRELRRKLLKEGSFFLMPEWTIRWKEIFKDLLELPPEHIKSILHEQHKKFVYLDTGVMPIPYKEIEDCSEFFNLPFEIEKVSLTFLMETIKSGIEDIAERK